MGDDSVKPQIKASMHSTGTWQSGAQVMIETVDSFQGKQLDVIILSCVRASDRRCACRSYLSAQRVLHPHSLYGSIVAC